jgi:hypothetical protein
MIALNSSPVSAGVSEKLILPRAGLR